MDWLAEANVSEKHTVSTFRAEVTMLGVRGIIYGGRKGNLKERADHDGVRWRMKPGQSALKMETVRFSETLASTSQSTRLPKPEEHHHQLL
jgi:hypothetical protein